MKLMTTICVGMIMIVSWEVQAKETSAYQLLTTLGAPSSEGLIKELMKIVARFSQKPKPNVFAKLKAHLAEAE